MLKVSIKLAANIFQSLENKDHFFEFEYLIKEPYDMRHKVF
jgi:hypothetical protein